jgi:hypothetical protein
MSKLITRLQTLVLALLNRALPRHTYDDQPLGRAADIYDVERRVERLDLRGGAMPRGHEYSQSFR